MQRGVMTCRPLYLLPPQAASIPCGFPFPFTLLNHCTALHLLTTTPFSPVYTHTCPPHWQRHIIIFRRPFCLLVPLSLITKGKKTVFNKGPGFDVCSCLTPSSYFSFLENGKMLLHKPHFDHTASYSLWQEGKI